MTIVNENLISWVLIYLYQNVLNIKYAQKGQCVQNLPIFAISVWIILLLYRRNII